MLVNGPLGLNPLDIKVIHWNIPKMGYAYWSFLEALILI
jgi:hypothetical protein